MLAFVVSLLTYILASAYFSNQIKGDKLVQKLESVLSENKKELEEAAQLINDSDHKSIVNPFETPFFVEMYSNRNLLVLFYKQDSLVFWNSNLSLPDSSERLLMKNESSLVQLSNGYYQSLFLERTIPHSNDSLEVFLLRPIYLDFPFQNDYLVDNFVSDIFPQQLKIDFTEKELGQYTIRIDGEETNFAVNFEWTYSMSISNAFFLLFLLLTILSIFYLLVIDLSTHYAGSKKRSTLTFWMILISILLSRMLLTVFSGELSLFQSELFDAQKMGYGLFNQSFGFLALDSFNFCALALAFKAYIPERKLKLNWVWRYLFLSVFIIFLVNFYVYAVRQLIFEAHAPLSFTELYNFNLFSYFIFLYISLITVSIYIIFHKLVALFQQANDPKIQAIGLFVLLNGLIAFLNYYLGLGDSIAVVFSIVLFSLFIWFSDKNKLSSNQILYTWSLLLFAALLTFLFYTENTRKAESEQQLTALQLSMEADPMFEFVYKSVYAHILSDTVVAQWINNPQDEQLDLESELLAYLKHNYSHSYLEKYNMSVTLCDPEDELLIKPGDFLTNCQAYFSETVGNIGLKSSMSPNLYYMEDNLLGSYYLAVIQLNQNPLITKDVTLFIEYYFKYIPEGLGYPELLVDESKGYNKLLSKYSLANYQDSVLIYKFGNYFYPSHIGQFNFDQQGIANQNGFRHLYHESAIGDGLIVSKPQKKLIDIIAPFSYFTFLLAILGFLIIGLGFYRGQLFMDFSSFRFKLQIFSLSTLMLSFFIIGVTSTVYIRGIYQQKSDDFLIERTQSILIELEHKLSNENILDADLSPYLHELLRKFSQVFFSDINLYDINGNLIATSRPEIFETKLISTKMNPSAFAALRSGNEYLFLHQESIGRGSFYSSYATFRELNGKAAAFVNLPYFARETELRNEISNFLLTYINIFLLLSGLFALVVLLFSRKLTKPLLMIQAKMKEVRIDQNNEPIRWHSEDEIGQLVNQYNQLITELAKSAELLARSERETAWREMAQQVAHEIKNPLTPMRLSVQHLKRSWDQQDADMEQKFQRTMQTLIEQIDTLAAIASAFSDFAKMPVNAPEKLEIADLIKRTALLYNSRKNIEIEIDTTSGDAYWVLADKKNLGRAFANLIKNAVQAIGHQADGKIHINLSSDNDNVLIAITDNGKGMNTAEQKKLFTPNFTTKSSGMGVGLSIVDQIIKTVNGSISFKSAEGKGTTFLIKLPKAI